MAILNAKYSGFLFFFERGFLYEDIETRWTDYVKRMPFPYDTVHNYINSTVQGVTFPGFNMETVQQMKKTKEIDKKNSKPITDLFNREVTITFKTTEGFTNYWILQENFLRFLSFTNQPMYLNDMYIRLMDHDGHIMSTVRFHEVTFTSMSELNLNYTAELPEFQSFDVTFKYNFLDINIENA